MARSPYSPESGSPPLSAGETAGQLPSFPPRVIDNVYLQAGLEVIVTPTKITDTLSIERLQGPRPRTTEAPPGTNIAQQQISDNAPIELQDELFDGAMALPYVSSGPSRISVEGARAFLLDADRYLAQQFVGNEFGHSHPEYDGSLHLILSPELASRIDQSGWGEPHPRVPRVAMVYGPRDDSELEVVWALVELAYRLAQTA